MMPVRKNPDGRRYVQAEVEVPGTPEQVWDAIATGPGVSSWFVPTEMSPGENGVPTRVISHFAADGSMDSLATVTAWEPPNRFAADSRDDMGPGDPTIATEWTVEAQAGGTCIVRVVHSWFASTDDWDEQFGQHEEGWRSFFRLLRLYLAHFPGQPCSAFQLMGFAPEPKEVAWASLVGPLGLAGAQVGQRVQTASGAPHLAGVAEAVGQPEWPDLFIRLDKPAPGIAHLFPLPMGGTVFLSLRFFLYGERAADAAGAAHEEWQTWLAEHFPPPAA